jgi:hypothetical protein
MAIFHADGRPYDAAEIELLRKQASRKEQR